MPTLPMFDIHVSTVIEANKTEIEVRCNTEPIFLMHAMHSMPQDQREAIADNVISNVNGFLSYFRDGSLEQIVVPGLSVDVPAYAPQAVKPEVGPEVESSRDRMKHFKYMRLTSERARKVSKAFHDLALLVLDETASGAEQASALRKLLEGKDAAVRAAYEMEG